MVEGSEDIARRAILQLTAARLFGMGAVKAMNILSDNAIY
jgi:hypothetical protein